MTNIILRFGLLAFALLALFQLSKYTLFVPSFSDELWIAIFAVLFLTLGFVMSRQMQRKPENQSVNEIDTNQIEQLGISQREYEVLVEIAAGKSNKEIADALFVSESTIKTHVSSLLSKLNARRRTHAVTRAKELKIIN